MRLFFVLLLIPVLCFGLNDTEEELFIRRIETLWQEQEIDFVENEIDEFLTKYPNSPFAGHAHALLGDIAFQKNHFQEALDHYLQGVSEPLLQATFVKRCHCLYRLRHYATLQETLFTTEDYFESLSFDEKTSLKFLLAESLFRQALPLFNKAIRLAEAKRGCRQALPLYLELKTTKWRGKATLAAAEIYRFLGNYKAAARHYLELAREQGVQNPPLYEELLFQGARMLAQFDTARALETFEKITKANGTKASESAYEWLTLLAENRDYDALLSAKEIFLTHLPPRLLPRSHIHFGWAYFEKKNYKHAIANFKEALQADLTDEEHQGALLAVIVSAKELGRLELLEETLLQLESAEHTHLKWIIEAKTVRAQAYAQLKEEELAETSLKELLEQYKTASQPEIQEALITTRCELSQLLMRQRRFKESRDVLLHAPLNTDSRILSLLPICSFKQLKNCENPSAKQPVYKQLCHDMAQALEAKIYSEEKRCDNELLLARCYLALQEFDQAKALLQTLTSKANSSLTSAAVHYLLALCHLGLDELQKGVYHGEQALKIDKTFQERRTLHLNLFNAYLKLDTLKAAKHLYIALKDFPKQRATEPISLQNLLWLARFNLDLALNHSHLGATKRAIFVYEHLLGRGSKPLAIPKKLLFLEGEVLHLANLYELTQNRDKQKAVLEELYFFQQEHSTYSWTQLEKTRYALALVYLKEKNTDEGITLLKTVQKGEDTHTAYKAMLALAHYDYKTLAKSKRLDYPQRARAIADTLSTVVMRKTLANEPTHLEAALMKAEIQASCFPKQKRNRALISLLNGVRKEFSHTQDIPSRDYHAALKQSIPEAALYHMYMRYIDAYILSLEATEADEPEMAAQKKEASLSLLASLKGEHIPLSLKKKVEELLK